MPEGGAAFSWKRADHIKVSSITWSGAFVPGGTVAPLGIANGVLDPTGSPLPVIPAAVPPSRNNVGASTGQSALFLTDAVQSAGTSSISSVSGSSITSASSSTSPFVINVTWDSSVASAPSGFQTAIMNAVQYLENHFSDAVTVNINVGYGEVGGAPLGSGVLGESEASLSSVGYSTLRNALTADATTSADASAVASLPSTSPVNGTFLVTTAEAKALGLSLPLSPTVDGYVGFSSSIPFTYNDTNGVAAGTYDFNSVAIHELTEVMGRILLTGSTVGNTANSYTPYDLFHYSSPGVRDFSASTPGYFSINSGNTSLAAFNTVSGGDAGDWASSVANDAFDAFSNSGVTNTVSSADLTALDVIGWNLNSSSPNTVACYRAGTLIATPNGEAAIETLEVGDLVLTADGSAKPVKWLGLRSYSARFAAGQSHLLPIRFCSGSLGNGRPCRDLWVSPQHAMLIDGALIPAACLVNGISIVQDSGGGQIDYIHVELERHDVIFAEGAASETYVDDDNRMMFHNAADYAEHYGTVRQPAIYCAERHEDGPVADAARRRLATLAGLEGREGTGRLRGCLDPIEAEAGKIIAVGWAQDETWPEVPVCLEVRDGAGVLARGIANLYRADLEDAGLGSGRHGFRIVLPVGAVRDGLEIRRIADGAVLAAFPANARTPQVA